MRVIAYACRTCGNRFKTSVANENELKEAIHQGRGAVPAKCPKCHGTDLSYDE